ncbi:MAG: LamG-like jellyroll fold domain-containing protein [Opitutales bacterium]
MRASDPSILNIQSLIPSLWNRAFSVALVASIGGLVTYASSAEEVAGPADIPNLLTFWDFQEPAGSERISMGEYAYGLEEMNGPIDRVEDGIFGPYSAGLEWGQWFRIERQDAPGLDLHGDDQQVTMVAWVKRESDLVWQYIAGMWNEGDQRFLGQAAAEGARAPARQYALFMSGAWQNDYTTYNRSRAEHQVHGYVSPFGGATPEHPFAFDYASGATEIEKGRWYMLAYTFDTEVIKVYVDGKLDENSNYNPFEYNQGIHDGGETGSDFTVAQRNHPQWPTYPEGSPEFPRYVEGFDGRIAGLAVYDRALTAAEIAALYSATME